MNPIREVTQLEVTQLDITQVAATFRDLTLERKKAPASSPKQAQHLDLADLLQKGKIDERGALLVPNGFRGELCSAALTNICCFLDEEREIGSQKLSLRALLIETLDKLSQTKLLGLEQLLIVGEELFSLLGHEQLEEGLVDLLQRVTQRPSEQVQDFVKEHIPAAVKKGASVLTLRLFFTGQATTEERHTIIKGIQRQFLDRFGEGAVSNIFGSLIENLYSGFTLSTTLQGRSEWLHLVFATSFAYEVVGTFDAIQVAVPEGYLRFCGASLTPKLVDHNLGDQALFDECYRMTRLVENRAQNLSRHLVSSLRLHKVCSDYELEVLKSECRDSLMGYLQLWEQVNSDVQNEPVAVFHNLLLLSSLLVRLGFNELATNFFKSGYRCYQSRYPDRCKEGEFWTDAAQLVDSDKLDFHELEDIVQFFTRNFVQAGTGSSLTCTVSSHFGQRIQITPREGSLCTSHVIKVDPKRATESFVRHFQTLSQSRLVTHYCRDCHTEMQLIQFLTQSPNDDLKDLGLKRLFSMRYHLEEKCRAITQFLVDPKRAMHERVLQVEANVKQEQLESWCRAAPNLIAMLSSSYARVKNLFLRRQILKYWLGGCQPRGRPKELFTYLASAIKEDGAAFKDARELLLQFLVEQVPALTQAWSREFEALFGYLATLFDSRALPAEALYLFVHPTAFQLAPQLVEASLEAVQSVVNKQKTHLRNAFVPCLQVQAPLGVSLALIDLRERLCPGELNNDDLKKLILEAYKRSLSSEMPPTAEQLNWYLQRVNNQFFRPAHLPLVQARLLIFAYSHANCVLTEQHVEFARVIKERFSGSDAQEFAVLRKAHPHEARRLFTQPKKSKKKQELSSREVLSGHITRKEWVDAAGYLVEHFTDEKERRGYARYVEPVVRGLLELAPPDPEDHIPSLFKEYKVDDAKLWLHVLRELSLAMDMRKVGLVVELFFQLMSSLTVPCQQVMSSLTVPCQQAVAREILLHRNWFTLESCLPYFEKIEDLELLLKDISGGDERVRARQGHIRNFIESVAKSPNRAQYLNTVYKYFEELERSFQTCQLGCLLLSFEENYKDVDSLKRAAKVVVTLGLSVTRPLEKKTQGAIMNRVQENHHFFQRLSLFLQATYVLYTDTRIASALCALLYELKVSEAMDGILIDKLSFFPNKEVKEALLPFLVRLIKQLIKENEDVPEEIIQSARQLLCWFVQQGSVESVAEIYEAVFFDDAPYRASQTLKVGQQRRFSSWHVSADLYPKYGARAEVFYDILTDGFESFLERASSAESPFVITRVLDIHASFSYYHDEFRRRFQKPGFTEICCRLLARQIEHGGVTDATYSLFFHHLYSALQGKVRFQQDSSYDIEFVPIATTSSRMYRVAEVQNPPMYLPLPVAMGSEGSPDADQTGFSHAHYCFLSLVTVHCITRLTSRSIGLAPKVQLLNFCLYALRMLIERYHHLAPVNGLLIIFRDCLKLKDDPLYNQHLVHLRMLSQLAKRNSVAVVQPKELPPLDSSLGSPDEWVSHFAKNQTQAAFKDLLCKLIDWQDFEHIKCGELRIGAIDHLFTCVRDSDVLEMNPEVTTLIIALLEPNGISFEYDGTKTKSSSAFGVCDHLLRRFGRLHEAQNRAEAVGTMKALICIMRRARSHGGFAGFYPHYRSLVKNLILEMGNCTDIPFDSWSEVAGDLMKMLSVSALANDQIFVKLELFEFWMATVAHRFSEISKPFQELFVTEVVNSYLLCNFTPDQFDRLKKCLNILAKAGRAILQKFVIDLKSQLVAHAGTLVNHWDELDPAIRTLLDQSSSGKG